MLAAAHSVLRPSDLIAHVLNQYHLGEAVTCQLLAHAHDDLYTVTAGDSRGDTRYVLRVNAVGKDWGGLEAQAHILAVMQEADLPVAYAIAGDAGYVMHVLAPEGPRYAMLYAHCAGVPAGCDMTAQQSSAYGQLMAWLHNVADAHHLAAPLHMDLAFLIDEPLRLIQPALVRWPHLWAKLTQLSEQIKRALDTLIADPAHLSFGLCHGDAHKSNLLVDGNGSLALIDWDCVGLGWRAYDVAVLRWSIGLAMGKEGLGEPRLNQVWSAYLEGYTQQRQLSAEDVAAIPYFVAARHLRVLGWEVDRALNGIAGTSHLTEGYFHWWIDTLEFWCRTYLFTDVTHEGEISRKAAKAQSSILSVFAPSREMTS